jgi:crotonobetainyl-CoA:carnitine CoA-transferase CaiB-like acyl-CoA transferase
MLEGIRVLDLTRLLPGPYATQLLADHGADVVKIEDPEVGDYARYMDPEVDGTGALFSAFNRGKRSLTLDLSKDEGREVLRRLVRESDVLIEGFSPGTMESLGGAPTDLIPLNESLIYCSISGYGQDGPYASRPGHDLNYAGYVGLVDMTRARSDDPPALPGVPITDLAGGLEAAYRIVCSLLARELDNEYENVLDVSLAEAALSFMQVVHTTAMAGEDPRPGETLLTGEYPCYGIYPTEDNHYVTLSALEPKFWEAFCREVDREDLLDLQLSEKTSEREYLADELTSLFRSRTRDEWEESLGDADVMVGSVLKPSEVVENEHFLERGLFDFEEYRVDLGKRTDDARPWPEMGEHNDSILGEAGYSDEDVRTLKKEGVV